MKFPCLVHICLADCLPLYLVRNSIQPDFFEASIIHIWLEMGTLFIFSRFFFFFLILTVEAIAGSLHSCERWKNGEQFCSGFYLFVWGEKDTILEREAALASVWGPAVMNRPGRHEKSFLCFLESLGLKGVFLKKSMTY